MAGGQTGRMLDWWSPTLGADFRYYVQSTVSIKLMTTIAAPGVLGPVRRDEASIRVLHQYHTSTPLQSFGEDMSAA